MEASDELNILDIAVQCRSKIEVYNVLTTSEGLYFLLLSMAIKISWDKF